MGIVTSACLLGACATPIKGTVAQGRYVAPNKSFSVELPEGNFGPNQETDLGHSIYVDLLFERAVSSFPVFGLYTVDWFAIGRPLSRDDFRTIGPRILEERLKSRFGAEGQFNLRSSAFVEEGEHPTLHFVSVGQFRGKPAHWFGSIIVFGDRVGIASHMAYLDARFTVATPSSADQLPARFVSWTRSLRVGE